MATREMIFASEAFRVDVECSLHDEMRKAKVTRSELAKRVGCTRGRIDRFFSGDSTTSIGFMAELFHALGFKMELKLRAADVEAASDV